MAKFCLFDQFLFVTILWFITFLFTRFKVANFNIVCGPGKSLIGIDQKWYFWILYRKSCCHTLCYLTGKTRTDWNEKL